MFERKISIIERVDAFTRCENAGRQPGTKQELWCQRDCHCNGTGGSWHHSLERYNPFREDQYRLKGQEAYPAQDIQVAKKSTILVREHGQCSPCSGRGYTVENYHDGTKMNHEKHPCKACHKDADGKPTGAEPNTAGPWRSA